MSIAYIGNLLSGMLTSWDTTYPYKIFQQWKKMQQWEKVVAMGKASSHGKRLQELVNGSFRRVAGNNIPTMYIANSCCFL